MVIATSYLVGILCCVFCCICWGSASNTQKMVARPDWGFEFFYLDFTIGLVVMALIGALTLGSLGHQGPTFIENLHDINAYSAINAIGGGIIWNFATIFLIAAIALTGISVGFPIGGGLGWIGGIIYNYVLVTSAGGTYPGNNTLLWTGVVFIILAIFLNAKAYSMQQSSSNSKPSTKGILVALLSGIAYIFFFGLVVKSINPLYGGVEPAAGGQAGTLTPYTAVFLFSMGILITTPIFIPFLMRHPLQGGKKRLADYTRGTTRAHLIGIAGGLVWMAGMVVSFMRGNAGNAAIAIGLCNAAPVVGILWGLFVWKEFKGATRHTRMLIAAVLLAFLVGLMCIALSGE